MTLFLIKFNEIGPGDAYIIDSNINTNYNESASHNFALQDSKSGILPSFVLDRYHLVDGYENGNRTNMMNRRWSDKYIDLNNATIKKYLSLKLEASPSILRTYGTDIKPNHTNSSYSKF